MFTFNGTGTMLYGRRDRQPDGSYVATKWLTVLYVPMLPLASFRVWREDGMSLVVYSSARLRLQRLPLQWRQVLLTWLCTGFLAPLFDLFLLSVLLVWAWALVESL